MKLASPFQIDPLSVERPHRLTVLSVPQSVDRNFNNNLHGARGFLAVLVFLFHISASGAPSFPWQDTGLLHAVMLSLQFSVEIFFCISGYVIVTTLGGAGGPVAFFRHRALRILPVLWVTLAVVVLFGLATHQGVFTTLPVRNLAWVLPANMVPLAGIIPIPVLHQVAWSLSYELSFYLIAAAFWWLAAKRYLSRCFVMILAACLVIWHPRAIFFIIGVGIARTDIVTRPWIRPVTRSPGLMLIGYFSLWYWVQLGGAEKMGTFFEWAFDERIGLAAVAIGFGTIAFAGIVAGQGLLCVVLRSTPLQCLGTLSFSFYLWHVIVIGVAKRLLEMSGGYALLGPWSQVALVAFCLPVSLLVATLSVHWIEQRFATWLRYRWLSVDISS